MLTRRVIPCLDIRDGRVVKGVRFQGLRDAGDPVERAVVYEAQGADEITVLDVSATIEARATTVETVARLREALSIPLTVGGGVRSADDVSRLLDAGADKVGINSAAVERPDLIGDCARRFGVQCIVVAIDAARADGADPHWLVRVRSGSHATALDAVEWARQTQDLGAGEILLTSWDRDGTGSGYDLDLVRAVAAAARLPVIASGGAAAPAHLLDALRAGASAVLAAGIFHRGELTVADVKAFLASRGVPIRPASALASVAIEHRP